MKDPRETIREAAEMNNCTAEIIHETTIKWCNAWQTYMTHTRTSQGWQCACGELWVSPEQDERNSKPIV